MNLVIVNTTFRQLLNWQSDDTTDCNRLRADTLSNSMAQMYNRLAGTASSNIRLIGSLELPHPGCCSIDVPRVEQIQDLLPHLQKIENRDLRVY